MEQSKIKVTKRHANKIFEWCVKTYGKSKYNKIVPEIEYRKGDHTTEECSAFYDEIEGIIFIDKDQNDTLEELANTIIHEYTHYKQNMKHYQILSLYLTEDKNPMELEAEQIAEKDTKKCLSEVFNM
jgi:hypothetical protein